MLPLGTKAPDFHLTDVVTGRPVSLSEVVGPRGLLVMFICAHCPFVKHVERELAAIGRDYATSGIGIVAISSNDAAAYPADAPAELAKQSRTQAFVFPYLYDDTQKVARAYAAACTPDFFLFDASHKLAYRGQLDDSRPSNGKPVTGHDLRAALDAVIAGGPVAAVQTSSIGCGIKWTRA
jgi:peroxiredoxin